MAAASILDSKLNICMIEKNENPGRKIMATGGGRCNITNSACEGLESTLGFFASLGLVLYEDEEGRYYPYTNRAADVVEALNRAIAGKVDVKCSRAATEILRNDDGFAVVTDKETVYAKAIILATGGKAAPQLGTTGDGYKMAVNLGHSTTRIYPILTGVECTAGKKNQKMFRDLKGLRARCAVSLLKDGEIVLTERGEIQFTEYGVSGICVFNLTPFIKADDGEDFRESLRRFCIKIDFAPDITEAQLEGRSDSFGIVTEKLAKYVDIDNIKDFRLQVSGVRGWRDAQCTAGGIEVSEVDMETMESKVCPGLFIAGEILDIQGPCGGFNLQNAWETGTRAGFAVNAILG